MKSSFLFYSHNSFIILLLIALLFIVFFRRFLKTQGHTLSELNSKATGLTYPIDMFRRRFWQKAIALTLASMCAVFALMQPALQTINVQKPVGAQFEMVDEIAFLIDVSASMNALNSQQTTSRIETAKRIISSIADGLGGVSLSLYAFAGVPQEIVPATLDYVYFQLLLDKLQIDSTTIPGTDFNTLIQYLQKKYLQSQVKSRVRFVILTDGEDTTLLSQSLSQQGRSKERLLQELQQFGEEKMPWTVIGLGHREGSLVPQVTFDNQPVVSKLDVSFLESMATATTGIYVPETAASPHFLVDQVRQQLMFQKETSLPGAVLDLSLIPLLIAFILMSMGCIVDRRMYTI